MASGSMREIACRSLRGEREDFRQKVSILVKSRRINLIFQDERILAQNVGAWMSVLGMKEASISLLKGIRRIIKRFQAIMVAEAVGLEDAAAVMLGDLAAILVVYMGGRILRASMDKFIGNSCRDAATQSRVGIDRLSASNQTVAIWRAATSRSGPPARLRPMSSSRMRSQTRPKVKKKEEEKMMRGAIVNIMVKVKKW